ncbi:MAG: hypothetical protein FWF14_05085 [Streptococcaceae bacterium]|nr:hypothetical protein [Streptococcaceae bacterium]
MLNKKLQKILITLASLLVLVPYANIIVHANDVVNSSSNGSLTEMVDQIYPSSPSPINLEIGNVADNKGVYIGWKYYTNAEFDKLNLKMKDESITVQTDGIEAEPRFLPVLAAIGVGAISLGEFIYAVGAFTAISACVISIASNLQNYIIQQDGRTTSVPINSPAGQEITKTLTPAQKAKIAQAKAKSPAKTPAKSGSFNPEKTAKKVLKRGNSSDKGYEQKDGSVWSKDRAGSNGHGGSTWKRYKNSRDFNNDKREGTYDGNGKRLRN